MALLPGVIGAGAVRQVDDSNNTIGVLLNPDVATDVIRAMIIAGMGFKATTMKQTNAAAGNFGMALFNPVTNTKNILIYSILAYASGIAGQFQLNDAITTDPALGTAAVIVNSK